ncbi:MAG: PAS domain-containing protein, partial [Spirochaetales bacterium]|nr:PAS domain-containing protein [Spirochaetales bacterium]
MSEFEHNLQVVFDNSDRGIIIHDRQGQILSTNRPAQQLFGISETDFVSRAVTEISAENADKTAQIPRIFQRVMDGEVVLLDWRCRKFVDKSSFDSQIYYTRITWNNETALMGMVQDVTEIKTQNALLHRLTTAVEQSANIVVINDLHGKIEYANPVIEQATGYTLKELIGRTPRIFKSDIHPAAFYKKLWETVLSGKIWRGELCNKHKNGNLIWEST